MSKDFKTTQLRVNKIINTAITPGDPLLLYGLNSAINDSGGIAPTHFLGTGSDVWMFISGSANSADIASSLGAVVFQGDVVLSGSMQISEVASSPATPASGKGVIYAKTDSLLYFKNDAGTEFNLTTGGGGGTPGSPSGSIQFNDGTSFGGSSNLKWINGSSNLFLTGALQIKGNSYIDGASYYNTSGTDYYIYINDNDAMITLEDQVNGVASEISANAGLPYLELRDAGGFGLRGEVLAGPALVANMSTYGAIDFKIDSDQALMIGSGSATSITIARTGTPVFISDQLNITGSIIPGADITYNIGSPTRRWANVYTGDLHLRNERGNWTIVEEEDFLCVINNLTGKKYKMVLQPLE